MSNTIAVIYRPEIVNITGPFLVSCPRPRPKQQGKNVNDVVELLNIWLVPGTNFFDRSDWELLINHPSTRSQIDSFLRRSVLLVKSPSIADQEVASNTTADYADLQDVRDLIYYTYDTEWLRRCVAKDNRPSVDKWCYERIDEIERTRNRPSREQPDQESRSASSRRVSAYSYS